MQDKYKAGGCMTMTSGLVLIGGCFLVAELSHMFIRKRMNKKESHMNYNMPQCFSFLFCMLLALQSITNFPPLLNVF